jgi:hypothetical protein
MAPRNCTTPVVSVVKRVADYDEANPGDPPGGRPRPGIGNATVHRARQQGVSDETPEDRPTLDNPPKGKLCDDQ